MNIAAKRFHAEETAWITNDFSSMVWFNCPIHALGFSGDTELFPDIDCIRYQLVLHDPQTLDFASRDGISFGPLTGR